MTEIISDSNDRYYAAIAQDANFRFDNGDALRLISALFASHAFSSSMMTFILKLEDGSATEKDTINAIENMRKSAEVIDVFVRKLSRLPDAAREEE